MCSLDVQLFRVIVHADGIHDTYITPDSLADDIKKAAEFSGFIS
jgi:hypothetical protein